MRRGESMSSVLDGVRVIDFGQYIAGPLTAMLLADQGADVIRVDPPGGPLWETPANATWNRGKRSITLHLKQPEDLAIATRLIASADVVIENFRPGVMERLGLGWQQVSSLNHGWSIAPCRGLPQMIHGLRCAPSRGSSALPQPRIVLLQTATTDQSTPPSPSLRIMLRCRAR